MPPEAKPGCSPRPSAVKARGPWTTRPPVPARCRGGWVLDLLGQADHPLGIDGE